LETRNLLKRDHRSLEIESIRDHTVHMLPYGLQKRWNWVGPCAESDLLLLDEPLAGLNLKR